MMGDKGLAAKVMDAFLNDCPLQIEALKKYLEGGKADEAARTAHSIKGAAASVGGERVQRVAQAMEKAADAGDMKAVQDAMQELEAEFSSLKSAMRER